MTPFAVIFTFCYLSATTAFPGFSHGGGSIKLEGVPNESHYGQLTYPSFDIIPLGSAIKGSLPPAVVEITKKEIIKEPQPYPVKVSVPVPHPVEVPKPYPVVQTKIVKVPQPVPYEVIKKIPVPIEVPKPFPVPHQEFVHGQEQSYGGSFQGHGSLGHQSLDEEPVGSYQGGFEGGYDHAGLSEGDQSGAYGTQVQVTPDAGWVPVMVQVSEEQQGEEHQQ